MSNEVLPYLEFLGFNPFEFGAKRISEFELTTHNNKAEQTNNSELSNLKTKAQTYNAVIEGKFPEYAYPNKEELVLKVGAQVMFVKNDSSTEKRYFNGKIGKVILLDKDEVVVKCPDDDFNIITTPEEWENINYTVDIKQNTHINTAFSQKKRQGQQTTSAFTTTGVKKTGIFLFIIIYIFF